MRWQHVRKWCREFEGRPLWWSHRSAQHMKDGCETQRASGRTDDYSHTLWFIRYVGVGHRNCTLNAWARHLPRRDSRPRAKMGQMHQCARGLCWKIMILEWNKWGTFNVVVTFNLIYPTYGILRETVAQLVEALRYKPEGREFDFRLGLGFFIDFILRLSL